MITQPLTLPEEEILRTTKNIIEQIDVKFNDTVTINIGAYNKEAWLSILNLAERANEIVSEQWRGAPLTKVEF